MQLDNIIDFAVSEKANFGMCLKVAMVKHDVSNIDVANYFGVLPQQVIRWKHKPEFNIAQLKEMSEFFRITPSTFVSYGYEKQ